MEYKEYVTAIFNYMKRKEPKHDYVTLAITDDDGKHIGWLKPITYDFPWMHPGLALLLGKWRKENPTLSASRFEISEENTTMWLNKLILDREDRLLFLIDTLDNTHVGHIGYSSFNFEERNAEIDCVLRGIPSPVPKMMTHALNTLLDWGFSYLMLKDIYLSTGKDNEKSIALYKRCGFKKVADIPLYRRELENEVRWDEDPNGDPAFAEKFAIKMKYTGEKE